MMGVASFDDQIASGKAKLDGDRQVFDDLKGMLINFELGFEIMPGTGAADLSPQLNPFAQEPLADTSGG
jgi:hypothetical protein